MHGTRTDTDGAGLDESQRLWKAFAGLVGAAVRSFVGTVLVVMLAGVALASLSFLTLADDSAAYGLLAAALAILEAGIAAFFLATKRSLFKALARGVRTFGLGRHAVRLVFSRMLGVASHERVGERGVIVAQVLEQLPLAQAEQRLDQVVGELGSEAAGHGLRAALRRRLQRELVKWVRTLTLARFRDANLNQGRVDPL